ncbi:MAG: hypothetical protein EPO09_09295 [Aquabacterium sp.]|uniref:hypothetical protein n=1 Tax=Aquabacterium sp. TaxID=1872578 RepID=UPI00120FF95D|nr:hypothetical protein [Aquabacterium sp.]TAK94621.1 MAG: hypothetical protein EPO09_09295 [Aquabacterium sp.]
MALSRLSSSLLILLATSTLLSACDLNNDDSDPAASATPSSDTPAVTATSSYLTGVRNAQAGDTFTAELVLVDDVTGTEVKATAIDAGTQPRLAQAFTVSADGKSYVAGRQTAAYYIYQHKLYELSLEHVSNELSQPTPRQISSETQACELKGVVETDATAHTSLLRYTSAGPDGDCSTPSGVVNKTALSSSNATVAPTQAFIDVQRDSAGAIARILSLDVDNKLTITNTSGVLQTTAVTNGNIAASTSVTVFGKVAGTTDKLYLRVGNDVRTLNWASASLDTTVLASPNLVQMPFVHTDDEATYFADVRAAATATAASITPAVVPEVPAIELVLWRLKPGQSAAEEVASLGVGAAEQMPEIAGHAMTPSSLALVIRRDAADTLTIIKKANGSQRNIALSGPTLHIDTLAHTGEILLASQQLVTGEDAVSVTRIDLANNDALSILSPSASLVTLINSPSRTLADESDNTHLIWREGGSVLSYNLSTNATPITIADSSTLNGWDGNTLKAVVSNLTQGLLRGISTDNPNADALWLFNANKAVPAR